MTLLLVLISLFLSTLSLRRATLAVAFMTCPPRDFYPRSPCGERRLGSVQNAKIDISIHALLAESDARSASKLTGMSISIHALLAESDH